MTVNKDFKRLVRDRMRKTGEAYTAARAHLLKKKSASPSASGVSTDYAKLAGMSDEKVKEATGCNWEKWVYALDRHGADQLAHRELAELINRKYKTGDWWTQMVAVGYERIRGLRTRGQRRDGLYSGNKSRTFGVPVDVLFSAWTNTATRKKWLTQSARIRTSQVNRSIRLGLADGTIVAVGFTSKGAKSTVAVQQEKLPSAEATKEFKNKWSQDFDLLAAVLKGD